MPIKWILVLCFLVLGGCQPDSYDDLYARAKVKFEAGDYELAASLVQKALAEKETAEAYKLLGNVYLVRFRNFQKAEEAYQKALSLNPHFPNAMHNIGLVYLTRYEVLWEKGYTIKSKKKKKLWKKKLAKAKKYLTKARFWFEKTLQTNPNFFLTKEEMVKLLFFEGKYHKAMELAQQILIQTPENFRILLLAAEVALQGLKDYPQALDFLDKATEVNTTIADLYWFRYLAYKKQKKKKKAKTEFALYLGLLKQTGVSTKELQKIQEKKIRYIP